jgi:hypothetical protein
MTTASPHTLLLGLICSEMPKINRGLAWLISKQTSVQPTPPELPSTPSTGAEVSNQTFRNEKANPDCSLWHSDRFIVCILELNKEDFDLFSCTFADCKFAFGHAPLTVLSIYEKLTTDARLKWMEDLPGQGNSFQETTRIWFLLSKCSPCTDPKAAGKETSHRAFHSTPRL